MAPTLLIAFTIPLISISISYFLYLSNFYSDNFKDIKGFGLDSDVSSFAPNIVRLQNQIEDLALISDHEPPSVTRILFTENDILARKFIKSQMEEAGLEVREDAIGNIFGRWQGSDTKASAILTGSHIDAIPHAGKYDGVIGVLGAIEAIRSLREAGFTPKRSIDVLMFTSEEPTRFGYGCIGSRMMSGLRGFRDKLLGTKDKNGTLFQDAASFAGYDKVASDIDDVIIPRSSYYAFVELHIEQGPILEREGIDIGMVTHIAAPATIKMTLKGEGGHAGSVLMLDRNDALLAGAEIALAVESHVRNFGSNDTVGTTGYFQIFPGAVNSIPREVNIEIDVRDINEERRNLIVSKIQNSAKTICKQRHVVLEENVVLYSDAPAKSHKIVLQAIEKSVSEFHLSHKPIISRAYHDSLFMSRVAPMGMIFIPCYKGYSHRTDEFVSPKDLINGVKVLALTLSKLSLQ